MKAYFSGGCFWCITPIFKIYGVDSVICGYSGGDEPNPSYSDVKSQKTGHRETIELEYDTDTISYEKLVEIFLLNIDPYDAEGQFIDRGFSYSPAILYTDDNQKKTACKMLDELYRKTGTKPAVSLERFKTFYRAEEEHQDYYLKNPEKYKAEIENSGRKRDRI